MKASPKGTGSVRRGTAYTPQQIIRYTIQSADEQARENYGEGLGHEQYRIIDPFGGTGIWLRVLIASGTLRIGQLRRKVSDLMLQTYDVNIASAMIASGRIAAMLDTRIGRIPESLAVSRIADSMMLPTDGDIDAPVVLSPSEAADWMTVEADGAALWVLGNADAPNNVVVDWPAQVRYLLEARMERVALMGELLEGLIGRELAAAVCDGFEQANADEQYSAKHDGLSWESLDSGQ